MDKRNIAAFDFDGTLTCKDSLFQFIRFSCGYWALLWGLIIFSPLMMCTIFGFYPRDKAKERFLSHFFKGMLYEDFQRLGVEFCNIINSFVNKSTVKLMQQHLAHGDAVYVITASIEEWVRPWCEHQGVFCVLATRMEVKKGRLTGRFATPNCRGEEKVRRFLEKEPQRMDYYLYAYGDSRGDRQLLDFSNEPTLLR